MLHTLLKTLRPSISIMIPTIMQLPSQTINGLNIYISSKSFLNFYPTTSNRKFQYC